MNVNYEKVSKNLEHRSLEKGTNLKKKLQDDKKKFWAIAPKVENRKGYSARNIVFIEGTIYVSKQRNKHILHN